MKKRKLHQKTRRDAYAVLSISQKCDAILINLDKLQQQIQNYPKTFAESIENLYKAAEELSDVCKKKKGLNRG